MNVNQLNNYSYKHHDTGYKLMYRAYLIDVLFPYRSYIESRLVRYMRTLYMMKKYNIKQCDLDVPLEIEYFVTANDILKIKNYIIKNKLKAGYWFL